MKEVYAKINGSLWGFDETLDDIEFEEIKTIKGKFKQTNWE